MRILFFAGKGGVGKSTMAAAAAWQLAQQYRVLIVSLDPAHNLGDIFRVALRDKKHRFTDSLYLKEIDLQKRSKSYLQREINVLSSTYRYLQTLNLDQCFSVLQYSPGIEEYALLTSIEETIRDEKSFDYIVFDTPPTGLTLRFLALPRVTLTWIERLSEIRHRILEKRYTIVKVRGCEKEETVLKYDPEDDEVLKRLNKMNDNYQSLTSVLQGANCSVILVFNPDVLSLRESQRLIQGLQDLNLRLGLLIDNKVTEENRPMAEQVERSIRNLVPSVPLQQVSLVKALSSDSGESLYDIPQNIISML
ncbi:MAG: ArsA family ATPase [Desulfoferrobacter sp.]